jgi:colanic acid biosynthesis glycosyl transferase WcaI
MISESRSPNRRVLFVNRSYWPDAEATGQLLTDLCESLADRFDVSVLCGQPNSNPTMSDFLPCGEQKRNGVSIHRLAHTQFNKRRGIGRISNLVSFTLAVKRWLSKNRRFDVIISETDPFLLPIVVAPYAKRTNAAYVAYLQDIYPDIAIRLGKAQDGWTTRWLRNRLRSAYHQANHIVVLSPKMKDVLVGWGLNANRIRIVPNWVDCSSVQPMKSDNSFRKRNGWGDCFVVMHSGNMGLSQKLDSLIHAVDHPLFPSNARLALVGGGASEKQLKELATKSNRASDIAFFPYQPREQLSQSLSSADLHVISVDPRIDGTMMPSKLYGILASATPVVVIAHPSSDVAKIVVENNVGVVSPDHDPATIASAIARLSALPAQHRTAMQDRARKLAETQFDKPICIEAFAALIESVVSNHKPSS